MNRFRVNILEKRYINKCSASSYASFECRQHCVVKLCIKQPCHSNVVMQSAQIVSAIYVSHLADNVYWCSSIATVQDRLLYAYAIDGSCISLV